MALPERAIFDALSAASGVTALVSTRIYPGEAAQDATLPLIVYKQSVDTSPVSHLNSVASMRSAEIDIEIRAITEVSVDAIAAAVRTALHGLRNDVFQAVFCGDPIADNDLEIASKTITARVYLR